MNNSILEVKNLTKKYGKKTIGLENVKEVILFPRDMNRLSRNLCLENIH